MTEIFPFHAQSLHQGIPGVCNVQFRILSSQKRGPSKRKGTECTENFIWITFYPLMGLYFLILSIEHLARFVIIFLKSTCGVGRWVESLRYSSATQAQPEMTSQRHASFWVTDKSLALFHNKMTRSYSNNSFIFILGDSWSLNSIHALMLNTFSIKDFKISFSNYCVKLYMTGTFNLCSKKKMLPKKIFP